MPIFLSPFGTYPSLSHSYLSWLNLAFTCHVPSTIYGSCYYLRDLCADTHFTWPAFCPGPHHLCVARLVITRLGYKMRAQTQWTQRSFKLSNCVGRFVYMQNIWVSMAYRLEGEEGMEDTRKCHWLQQPSTLTTFHELPQKGAVTWYLPLHTLCDTCPSPLGSLPCCSFEMTSITPKSMNQGLCLSCSSVPKG